MSQSEQPQSSEGMRAPVQARISGGIENRVAGVAAGQVIKAGKKVASGITRKSPAPAQSIAEDQAGGAGAISAGGTGQDVRQMAQLGSRTDTARSGTANPTEGAAGAAGGKAPGSVGEINNRVKQMAATASASAPMTKEAYEKDQAMKLGMPGTEGTERRKESLQKQADSHSQAAPLDTAAPYQNLRHGTSSRIGTSGHSATGASPVSMGAGMTAEEKRKAVFDDIHSKTSADKISGARAVGAGKIGGAMESEIKEKVEVAGLKNKIALKVATSVAGDQAMRILSAASAKMAQQAERGGSIGALIIGITYFIALIKDCSDLLPGVGLMIGIALGLLISLFWLQLCGSNHGMLARWMVKLMFRTLIFFLFDGTPFLGILPLFLFMNVWNHHDYNQMIKQAEKRLEDNNRDYERVQRETRRAVNSI